ncbi:hypothetical protein DINM_006185 [Dirofilaria immitis]|nr:hypothetical protein [Dirofilaria immitis]
MANIYEEDDKFAVTMTTDTLQNICYRMEEDDPEAKDEEPVNFVVWNTQFTTDLMDEAVYNAEIIDIVTPSWSPTGISEYAIIMPRRHRRRAYSYAGERLQSSPNLSESRRSSYGR